ncbi:SepM family pheromone-processing serine protease [Lactobacillus psittaci]|uniref:endopeptidase La n=1 Tax=Lactobacillus psittaci DSM 15354 TaxID=1122152 RepID=A0A0R1S9Q1_9LACO|nr:SepM family pheromone-processing serine protease [Lactobacillus psittaci]KRL63498.1 hypothetical protein FC23_GL000740 [Lactobacillus psittaci DSM 15354]
MEKERINSKKKTVRNFLIGLITIVIVIIGLSWPTSYYIESPGDANSVSQFVKSGKKAADKNLYMVTVAERQASVLDYLLSFSREFDTRISQKNLMGNQNSAEYEQLQQWYMETSQNNAIYYAAQKAGVSAKKMFLGVYVMGIAKNSNFKHDLKLADVITAVNDQKFDSTKALMDYIQKQKIGQKIKVTVLRGNETLSFTEKTTKLTGSDNKAAIGIQLVERTKVITKPEISINAGSIGGPSAGLMFSLASYQLLTSKNLTHGQKIAGTGTIDDSGNVGMIGGVDKKVVAANNAGATVFFAPTQQLAGYKKSETNYAVALKTAKKIHSKMKIVPVATFDNALNYLKKIK